MENLSLTCPIYMLAPRDIWNKYATIASALGIAAIYSGLFEAEDNPLNHNLDTMEQYIEHVLKIEPD